MPTATGDSSRSVRFTAACQLALPRIPPRGMVAPVSSYHSARVCKFAWLPQRSDLRVQTFAELCVPPAFSVQCPVSSVLFWALEFANPSGGVSKLSGLGRNAFASFRPATRLRPLDRVIRHAWACLRRLSRTWQHASLCVHYQRLPATPGAGVHVEAALAHVDTAVAHANGHCSSLLTAVLLPPTCQQINRLTNKQTKSTD